MAGVEGGVCTCTRLRLSCATLLQPAHAPAAVQRAAGAATVAAPRPPPHRCACGAAPAARLTRAVILARASWSAGNACYVFIAKQAKRDPDGAAAALNACRAAKRSRANLHLQQLDAAQVGAAPGIRCPGWSAQEAGPWPHRPAGCLPCPPPALQSADGSEHVEAQLVQVAAPGGGGYVRLLLSPQARDEPGQPPHTDNSSSSQPSESSVRASSVRAAHSAGAAAAAAAAARSTGLAASPQWQQASRAERQGWPAQPQAQPSSLRVQDSITATIKVEVRHVAPAAPDQQHYLQQHQQPDPAGAAAQPLSAADGMGQRLALLREACWRVAGNSEQARQAVRVAWVSCTVPALCCAPPALHAHRRGTGSAWTHPQGLCLC